jgi:pimeloyl-ACP methyl ester carboxylesterase
VAGQRDIAAGDGRTLCVHDSGGAGPAVLWFHGSPQTGALLDPVLAAAEQRGLRLVSYGRPSYGGSSPRPGRDVASAAADVEAIAGALGLERFAALASSGGGPHALACAALLPRRVTGVVLLAGIAPLTDGYDWFDGMADPSGLRAAQAGPSARAAYARTAQFDPASFVAADYATLRGSWASLVEDVARANADGPDGLIDDDLAFVASWGFDLADVAVPVLLVQGADDRVVPVAHARWMAAHIPGAELRIRPGDGHISVLDTVPAALDWLLSDAI